MFAYADAQILDVTAPLEVLAIASRFLDERGSSAPRYSVEVVAPSSGPVRMSSGIAVLAERATCDVRFAAVFSHGNGTRLWGCVAPGASDALIL